MWWWVLALGYVLEGVGLCLAVSGLWRTWRDNADGADFLSARVRRVVDRLRRKQPVQDFEGEAHVNQRVHVDERSMVVRRAGDLTNLEHRILAVEENAVAAIEAADRLRGDLDALRIDVDRNLESLTERVGRSETTVVTFTRSLVVDGVPRAVVGLGLTICGLVLQGVASLATLNG